MATTEQSLMDRLLAEERPAAKPTGYHLLIRLPDKTGKTSAGLYVPAETSDREHAGSIIAEVIAVGDEAYWDKKKFPFGPWCQVGDWVMFRRYAGVRFRVLGDEREHRILNDDSVDAVVDPERVQAV